jgi:hypothetical protein
LQQNECETKSRHITTNTCFVAIRSRFFATISMTSATCQNCCNICPNITTKIYFVAIPSLYCDKMTNLRNTTQLSQYHYHITTLIHLVAIRGFYCNKRSTYRDETKLWQYVAAITMKWNFVVISHFIATKDSCSNKFCCNIPGFL